eukprot:TRINITY_DN3655_c0_g3_i1.p1 TRINITY_DN3655_c0_g3~~TRINITY_DN3655_c0_g3_i1.p1  ORF type:complete len:693 (-),score=87.62 TRINITY_DN3655_c0_g3_i1:24-1979(-)
MAYDIRKSTQFLAKNLLRKISEVLFNDSFPLHLAAQHLSESSLKILVKITPPDQFLKTDKYGNYPIQLLVHNSDESFNFLLEEYQRRGIRIIGMMNNDRESMICLACKFGTPNMVNVLIEMGCNYLKPDINGCTGFHHVCRRGYTDIVSLMLDKCDDSLISIADNNGASGLHYACMHGYSIELFRMLLNHRVFINCKDKSGLTPLHYICRSTGNIDIIELFIKSNADVNARDKLNETPLHHACRSQSLSAVKVLIKYSCNVNVISKEGITPLYLSAENGELVIFCLLLEAGAIVESNTLKHPMVVAAKNGNMECVRLLLLMKFKQDVGDQAYLNACQGGHFEIVQLLIEHGQAADISDENGNTSLHYACKYADLSWVNLILKTHGSELLNNVNNNGETPLHIASMHNNTSIFEMLLRNGADVYSQCNKGENCLHRAIANGCDKIARILIVNRYYLDLYLPDNLGYTPMHYACLQGSLEIVKLLVENGSNISYLTKYGKTPKQLCAENTPVSDYLTSLDSEVPKCLRVSIKKGRNLVSKDRTRIINPYMIISFGKHKVISGVVDKSSNWNENFNFPLKDKLFPALYIECWDKGIEGDEFLGKTKIEIGRFIMNVNEAYIGWFKILTRKKKRKKVRVCGEIQISLTFLSSYNV